MGVSENRGTPKSSILIGISIINHPFWGITILGNTQICSFAVFFVCFGVESIYNLLALGRCLPYHWGASSPNLAEADRVLIDRCMLIFQDVQAKYVCSILFGSLNS